MDTYVCFSDEGCPDVHNKEKKKVSWEKVVFIRRLILLNTR